jgi:hypothetical protein
MAAIHRCIVLLLAFYGIVEVNSFAPSFMKSASARNSYVYLSTLSDCDNDSFLLAKQTDETEEYSLISSRRQVFKSIGAVLTAGAVASTNSQPTAASASAEKGGPTIWQSGKAPQVPGQKPKDKNDVKGTRRDPSFLRSISDCKSQCENTSSNTGLAKSKEDCLSECQDICCTTYEQCTFAIVPRI